MSFSLAGGGGGGGVSLVALVAGLGSVERRGALRFHPPIRALAQAREHGSVLPRFCLRGRVVQHDWSRVHEPVPEPEHEDVEQELALRC